MRRFCIIVLLFINIVMLLHGCKENRNFPVEKALNGILYCENYKYEWLVEDQIENGTNRIERRGSITNTFHNPYKSKSESMFSFEDGDFESITGYQIEVGSKLKEKYVYYYKNGNIKELENKDILSDEWFIYQINKCLLSEEYIEDCDNDGIVIKKYRVTTSAYPFIIFFGVPFDKKDRKTEVFNDLYQQFEGYIYIDAETGNDRELDEV